MKAAVLKEFNSVPALEEVAEPVPGAGEVVIRQKYTGICYRDILTLKGRFPRTRLPVVPGHEVAGTVVSIGEGVESVSPGDRVASLIYVPCGVCRFCTGGRENLCRSKVTLGEGADGSYAPLVRTHQRSLVRVPPSVDEESAVISACVTGMIIQALKNRGRLSEGETVLVTGAGGGAGSHAVQIAKALGAKVIAATGSSWKEEGIYALGADSVVANQSLSGKVKELTGGEGADVAVDTVGGPTFREALKSMNFGGRLVVIGNVDSATVDLPLGYMILKGLELIGSVSSTRKNVAEALELTRTGRIRAVIDRKIGLGSVGSAYADMEKRSTFGRVLIDLSAGQ